ncbi:hypothetical protein ONS95_003570 [Cadophora gregata]|uniref:uncharacterized protein n=1 Tax=Cadophora gregata TaxID=51156 RepID=UPI0026DB20CB|nr:uncharacterized protein ONS95_003570 [Cadophora gregata]KAK0099357.1 hypothetical protein ONS96_008387 [Cadophora gregata f. sp. sojae]KAK0106848.1 hypothetical protein ONS95_003570 [Cadophora gregata]
MPNSDHSLSNQRRLVLCFDGTGNKFQGAPSDTNIVKLFQMLDRRDPNQFHYYQPGIGTYSEGGHSKPQTYIARLAAKISAAIDQGVGTSFVDHVVAGYRFLMRYYQVNDAIYIFGFSRGAYTARFLAEMVHTIGLLSQGNEEMIHFAWETFSEFQKCRGDERKSEETQEHEHFMVKFKQTFCRQNVKIHFLGLFDCVNSVGQFEVPLAQKSFTYIPRSSATHVRHAVSIHERRLKFKPALFRMDNKDLSNDTVEMWFAGNHGDVGGGWDLQGGQRVLLSDTPLLWMLEELHKLPRTNHTLSFRYTSISNTHSTANSEPRKSSSGRFDSRNGIRVLEPHDMLTFGKGISWLGVLFWWILGEWVHSILDKLSLSDRTAPHLQQT